MCSGLLFPGTDLGKSPHRSEYSMSTQRRVFSAEFKREATALVLAQGYSHNEACRSLGAKVRRCAAG